MRALVKVADTVGLQLKEIPEPSYGINDVLIKVLRTGICGTDLHIYRWDSWAQEHVKASLTVGHEFVGEIVAVGSNVNDFSVGQIVSGEGHLVCGRCRNCMAGRRHLCAHTAGVGVDRDGAFAEYIALPMTNIWVHHPGIDLDVAAIFDPFGNAVHSALSFELFGEDVLITGAGPIGLMSTLIAAHAGARHIVISDINPYRLELAQKIGRAHVVNPQKQPLPEIQKELGMTEGFDVGIEMSGNAQALRDMVANMAHGGKIALLGLYSDLTTVDLNHIIHNMLTLKGIYGRQMYESWYAMSVMVQSGLDISPVITHRFSASNFDEAFAIVESGNAGKVLLNWEKL